MIKISFIIPAYNCQDTISNCIRSIQSCDYRNIEILIINDCSSDNTLKVCNKLSTSENHIKVFSNDTNKGTSTSRNIGLNNTTGDYIWFVDSDDTINPRNIEDFLSVIKDNPNIDLYCFNHNTINGNSIETSWEFKKNNGKPISGIEYLQRYNSLYLWDKIYSSKLINNTRFVDGTKNIEDLYFNLQTISKAQNIYLTDNIGYNYNCNTPNSTSRNKSLRNLVKLSSDTMIIHQNILKDIHNCANNDLKNVLKNILNYSIAGHFFSLFRFYNYNYINRIMLIYKQWNVYPVKYTTKFKANIFITLVNSKFLFATLYKIISKLK